MMARKISVISKNRTIPLYKDFKLSLKTQENL